MLDLYESYSLDELLSEKTDTTKYLFSFSVDIRWEDWFSGRILKLDDLYGETKYLKIRGNYYEKIDMQFGRIDQDDFSHLCQLYFCTKYYNDGKIDNFTIHGYYGFPSSDEWISVHLRVNDFLTVKDFLDLVADFDFERMSPVLVVKKYE